jgi:nucleoside-diphosphate kinase
LIEKTLVVIKPDAFQRRLIGRIIDRFEDKGLSIVALKSLLVDKKAAREMYSQHEGKEFFEALVTFIMSGPVVAIVLEGPDAIGVVRMMVGPTFGHEAPPGTIRGDFGVSRRYNLIHAADSPESAASEIAIFFDESELLEYSMLIHDWEKSEIDHD